MDTAFCKYWFHRCTFDNFNCFERIGSILVNDQKYILLTSCKLMNNELFIRVYKACGPIVGTSNSMRNLAVGVDQELSHLVSNCDNKDFHFKF